MFYSVTLINGELVTLDDPFSEVTVTTLDFFDYDVKENDIVTFENGKFSFDKVETDRIKKENFDRVQALANS